VNNLNENWRRCKTAVAILALTLAGCGGGGGGGTDAAAPQPEAPAQVTLSGVAAQGAPMARAAIELVDGTGSVLGTTQADDDGKYTLTLSAAATAPFVISAAKDSTVYYSPVAEAKSGTVNITKLTNLIAAQLSATGDPSMLAAQLAAGTARFDATQVQAVVSAVMQALQPLLQNVGDSTDPISGTFDADGSGHDKVLMALDIAIKPAGSSSNITLTVKSATADGEQPPTVSFAGGTPPPVLPQQVATAVLPASDTDALVTDFLARLTACYALPRTERVSGTTAASVIAPTCRQVFTQDDPVRYRNYGSVVSPTGSFSGLFRDGATGVTFTQPEVEFLLADGKMLVGWKNTATDGGITYNRAWVQREDGKLKAVGNGYAYSFTVRAWSELRDFINRPELSYHATGFEVNVPNYTSGGSPIFDHVVVTAPNGATITMLPAAGLSYLPVQGTSTSVLRLAGRFLNPSTSGVPRRLSGVANGENLVWATNPDGSATDWTDAQLMAINNVGRWKADFYLASAPTTIAATQYHETLTRPLTVPELQQRRWVTLTAAARADAVAASSATGYAVLAAGDVVDLSVSGTPADFWTVPAGALGPTLIQAQGFVANAGSPAPRWNDSTSVSSLVRKTLINCSSQSSADQHCSSASSGTYSGNARLNLLQMFAYDMKDMEWASNLGLYLLSGIN
jgi:hypothetical protein